MAYFLNGVKVVDTTGWNVPVQSSRPASPVEGQVIYNTTNKSLEMYDAGYWITVQDFNRPYLYRTVITTSYVFGGYKNSSPWKNANRMAHSTDICTNLGDLMTYGGSYISGAAGLVKAYHWGADNSWPGSSNIVCGLNMATETNAGTAFGVMRNSRDASATVFAETRFAYIAGGGTADVDVFNLTTESMYLNNQGPDASGSDNAGAMSDETAGYHYTSGGAVKFLFSTTVAYATIETGVRNAHGEQKGINSKLGRGWGGNEGSWSGGYNLRRWQFSTDTSLGTVAKPFGNGGEENYDMGQDHQYMMGNHDQTGQNNRGWRFSYTTESGYELGSGSIRTGVPGGSSAACAWKG
jgi:hypothetical protein